MAEFHLHGQIIKRSQGRSAVNAAAYRAGELLYDKRLDRTFDYTRKQEVEESIILGPDHAPKWLFHREMLWNTVEAAERRKSAQVAREFDIALPIELVRKDPTAAKGALKSWAYEMFVTQGLMVDINFHNMRSKNPHAHIMTTMRRVDPQAMEVGQESRYAFESTKARDQNDWGYMDHWRETWADYANAAMAGHGIEARIDHRTLIEQGVTDREPNIHIGPIANAMEARGSHTGRWLKNALIWFHNEEPWFEENRRYLAFLEAEEAKERHREEEEAARKEAERKEIEAAAAIVARADVLADFSHRLDEAGEEIIGDYAVRIYSAAERIEAQAGTAVERRAPHLQSLDNRLSLAQRNVQTARKRLEDTATRLDKGIARALATRSRRLQSTATKFDRARPAVAMRVAEVRRRVAETIEDVRSVASYLAAAAVRMTAKSAEVATETLGAVVLRTTSFLRNVRWREEGRRRVYGSGKATKPHVEAPVPARGDGEDKQLERDLSGQRFSLLELPRSLAARLRRVRAVRRVKAKAKAEAALHRNMQLAEEAIRAGVDHSSTGSELKFVRDWIRTMRSTEGPMETRYREADLVALRGYVLSLDAYPHYGDVDRALIRLSPFAGGVDTSARHAPSELPEGMKPDFRDRAFYSQHVRGVVQELEHDLTVVNHLQKLLRKAVQVESHDPEISGDIDLGRYTRRVHQKGGWEVGGD